jgi:cytochrome c-type biogenesis protein CcmH/NrfG
VARGTQHRKRRPKPDARAQAVVAAPPRKQKPPQWQEELFFQRLRNHAKWMFVLLALVFAVGFVFFGVGSGNGLSDALQNAFSFGKSTGGSSISKLQSKADKHPQDASAWRDLATALEQKQRPKDAVTALERYTALRPKDQGALSELASQYNNLATIYSNDYSAAQAQAAAQAPPGEAFAPPASSPFGKAFSDPNALQDPIAQAVSTLSSAKQSTAYTNYVDAQQKAVSTYKKLEKLNPNDATTQIQLGQAALGAKDTATAITAFEKFLKLAPTDPLAGQVKQALKQLKASAAASASTAPSG